MSNLFTNQMLDTLKRIPAIVDAERKAAAEQFGEETLRNSGRIYLAGDGAAFAAAYALKTAFVAFTEWTGNWVESMTEREFAYEADREALRFGKSFVLLLRSRDSSEAISAAAEKKCAENGCLCAVLDCAEDGAAAYLELYAKGLVLAAETGRAQGKLDSEKTDALYAEIRNYAAALEKAVPELEKASGTVAEKMKKQVRNYETIGTGMDYAAAWLLRYALYRSTGRVTTVEESEDYLHVNSLNVNPTEFGTFVYNTAGNPAYGRTLLTIGNVELTNRLGVVITDGDAAEITCPVDILQMPAADTYAVKGLGMFIGGVLVADQLG